MHSYEDHVAAPADRLRGSRARPASRSIPHDEGFPLLIGRWKWFEQLRQNFGVAIEVFDPNLQCMLEAPSGRPLDRALRSVLEERRDARVREAADTALRSATACSFTAEGLRVRLFPLFTGADSTKMAAGLLAIADVLSEEPVESGEALRALDQRLDSVGQWLGAAIEATIDSARHDLEQAQAAERLAGIVEVVGALGQIDDEAQVIQLTMEAAALWYDADVRVYRRDADGSFVLGAKLPGANGLAPARLPGSLIAGRDQVFRLESSMETDEFGWDRPAGDTLFVPINVEDSTEWLIAVSGAADALAAPTLIFLHRLLEPLLENLDWRVRGRFRQKLASIMAFADAPFESTARIGLEALGREIAASSIQLAITYEGGHPAPEQIEWRGEPQDIRPADSDKTAAEAGADRARHRHGGRRPGRPDTSQGQWNISGRRAPPGARGSRSVWVVALGHSDRPGQFARADGERVPSRNSSGACATTSTPTAASRSEGPSRSSCRNLLCPPAFNSTKSCRCCRTMSGRRTSPGWSSRAGPVCCFRMRRRPTRVSSPGVCCGRHDGGDSVPHEWALPRSLHRPRRRRGS